MPLADPKFDSTCEPGAAIIQSSVLFLVKYHCQCKEADAAHAQPVAGPPHAPADDVYQAQVSDEDTGTAYPLTLINFNALQDLILEANLNKGGRTAKPGEREEEEVCGGQVNIVCPVSGTSDKSLGLSKDAPITTSLNTEASTQASVSRALRDSHTPATRTTRFERRVSVRLGPRTPDESITAPETDEGKGRRAETKMGDTPSDATLRVDEELAGQSEVDHALFDEKIKSNRIPPHLDTTHSSSHFTIVIPPRQSATTATNSKAGKRQRAAIDGDAEVDVNTKAQAVKKVKQA
ncbi:hypothetical protein ONZ45_g16821 [Pleurotus djamor]|nr:hypothetical protein ONZ45_g16821 [Pleurotus djamor]